MRTIGRALLIVALCATAHAQVLQEQHPNSARGFEPEKMYDFSAVDSVNVFNGNLTLRVPIGPKMAVNGVLPYQLTLTYNSNCWDQIYWYDRATGDGGSATMLQSLPTRRANAGIGWSLALGRILPVDATEPHDHRVGTYESSDGADHPLYRGLHDEPAQWDGVNVYSRDGTYIHGVIGQSSWLIELPDGIKQTVAFLDTATTPWSPVGTQSSVTTIDRRLTEMTDRFGNSVSIRYETTATDKEVWTITGAGGPIKAYFKTPVQLGLATTYDKVLLDRVDVPTVDGGTATYQLHYQAFTTPPGAGDTFTETSNHEHAAISAAFLTEITLPGLEKYSFTYDTQWDETTHTGTLTPAVPLTMTLPTGGTVQWSWDQAVFEQSSWQKPGTETPVPLPSAVQSRYFAGGTWTYTQTMAGTYCSVDLNGDPCPPNNPLCFGGMRQKTVAVTAPNNTTAINYFSIYKRGTRLQFRTDFCAVPEGWNSAEYGLPLTRYATNGDGGSVTLFASSEVRTGFSQFPGTWDGHGRVPGQSLRSSWTAYDLDAYDDTNLPLPPQNPRVTGRMTRYEDDTYCQGVCYRGSNSFNFDGYGHFRQESSFSNFGKATSSTDPFLTTFTNYDGFDGSHWVLNTWSEQCVAQETSQRKGAVSACSGLPGAFVTQAQFDRATGAMTARRTICAGCSAPSSSGDLLAVFERDSAAHGNVTSEKYYGGDVHPLTSGAGSFTTASLLEYQIDHSFTFENNLVTKASSSYHGTALNIADSDFDKYTGFMTHMRDSAGVQTNYDYDSNNNRLTAVKPAGRAWTEYTYTTASGSTPASIAIKQRPYGSTAAVAPLLDKRIVFDSWGRPLRHSQYGPNSWTAFETTFDAEGRPLTVSEPESTGSGPPAGSLAALNKTSYSYDPLGRQSRITPPEQSAAIEFFYVGARQKTRRSSIWTGGTADQQFDVIEQYDGAGRLTNVTQRSGPTTATSVVGGNVSTSYGYDAANHLTAVKMAPASGAVQNRMFDYDGRGFLRWESQPESGIASYAYDSRGHAASKLQSGGNTQFDLTYEYDGLERLLKVNGRNPYPSSDPAADQPTFRPIKEFTYGTANAAVQDHTNYLQGKLVSAVRHNYGETAAEPEYKVEDTYDYVDAAGRKTNKTTNISEVRHGVGGWTTLLKSLTMSVAYDDLDEQTTVSYPMCTDCGGPPTDTDHSGMTRGYTAGRLTSLSGVVTSISYWPDGLRNVLVHANGIADTQTVDKMPRPSQLQFGTYDRCVKPTFVTQPASLPMSGTSVTLSVSVSGTGPFTYTWYDTTHTPNQSVGAGQSIQVSPAATTSYYVIVSNACGFEQSQFAKVTVNECPAPSTGIIKAKAQPDGSWILTPNPIARQPRTYGWKRLSDNAVIGAAETQPIGQLSATTTYQLTITDGCGSGSGTVTVNIPLPITTGLAATASLSPLSVTVTWPRIAGATQYTVERRSMGGAWQSVVTTNDPTTTFTDTTVVASRTYVYHVTADNGGKTNYDVATTMSFTSATAGQVITATPMNSMLDAVNKVREAAGWAPVTWSNILAANDPLPAAGQPITARQLMACRARMNEALQALGVRVVDYTDSDLAYLTIRASYINEVEARAQ